MSLTKKNKGDLSQTTPFTSRDIETRDFFRTVSKTAVCECVGLWFVSVPEGRSHMVCTHEIKTFVCSLTVSAENTMFSVFLVVFFTTPQVSLTSPQSDAVHLCAFSGVERLYLSLVWDSSLSHPQFDSRVFHHLLKEFTSSSSNPTPPTLLHYWSKTVVLRVYDCKTFSGTKLRIFVATNMGTTFFKVLYLVVLVKYLKCITNIHAYKKSLYQCKSKLLDLAGLSAWSSLCLTSLVRRPADLLDSPAEKCPKTPYKTNQLKPALFF